MDEAAHIRLTRTKTIAMTAGHLDFASAAPTPTGRLTMTEFGQINDYATAITAHPEVVGTPHDWDFWLVGTEIDDAVRNLYSDAARPGLTAINPGYRIWVMTWGQLLDQADRGVQAMRSALELVSTDETSRAYLQRKHAEFIPPLAAAGCAE